MVRHAGAYKSEKRKKELLRKKRQEDKRQKRLGKIDETGTEENSAEREAQESKTDAS